jgi:hypothetical protein
MSISIKGTSSIHYANKLNEKLQNNTEATSKVSVKNQLRFNNIKRNTENNQVQDHSVKSTNINIKNSHCVSNLNLTKVHIDRMRSEKSNIIFNKKVKKNIPSLDDNKQDRQDKQECFSNDEQCEFNEPKLNHIDVYHIQQMRDLYFFIEDGNRRQSEYIIIVIYQMIKDTDLISKQLITAIPIVDGVPRRTIGEISIISHTGNLEKYHKTICLHTGGIKYTKDWLKIENSERINVTNSIFKLLVDHECFDLKGICLVTYNTSPDEPLLLDKSTIFIPEFTKIWI